MAGPRGASPFQETPDDSAPEASDPDEVDRARERALGLLAVRSRSDRELRDRLHRAGFSEDAIAPVMEGLTRVGLVDDRAFARELAEFRFRGRLEGSRAVRTALWQKGLAPDVIDAAVAEAEGEEDEDARAGELARSRVGRLRSEPPEKAYARLLGFLQRRGYGYGPASRAARLALALDADPE